MATPTITEMPWPVHPEAERLPMMSDEAIDELAKDIEANGLNEPFILWEDNSAAPEPTPEDPQALRDTPERGWPVYLLDGRNRFVALAKIGQTELAERQVRLYQAKELSASGWKPGLNPAEYVMTANVWRRHLTAAQKKQVIRDYIKAHPRESDREVARTVGVDHKTVGAVRFEEDAKSDTPSVEHVPIERALAIVRKNPDISHRALQREAGVGSSTAKAAKNQYAAEQLAKEEAKARRAARGPGSGRRTRQAKAPIPEAVKNATKAGLAAATKVQAARAALAETAAPPAEGEAEAPPAEVPTGQLTEAERALLAETAPDVDVAEVEAIVVGTEEAQAAHARAQAELAAEAERKAAAAKSAQLDRILGRLVNSLGDIEDRALRHLDAPHIGQLVERLDAVATVLRQQMDLTSEGTDEAAPEAEEVPGE